MHIFAYKLITSRRQTLWRSKRKKERAKKASQCVKLSASARNRKIRSCAIACARGVTFHKSHSHTHTNKLIYARTIKCNALRGMHSEKNTRKFRNNFTFECTVGKKINRRRFWRNLASGTFFSWFLYRLVRWWCIDHTLADDSIHNDA